MRGQLESASGVPARPQVAADPPSRSSPPTLRRRPTLPGRYNIPVWYVLAWDHLRDDVRSFRVDRIKELRGLPTEFRLRRADAFLTAGEPDARTV